MRSIIVGCLCLLPFLANCQKLEGGIFLGGVNYTGDVVEPSLSDWSETKFAYGLMLRHNFTPKWALRGSLLLGKVTGSDMNYDDPTWRQNRGFNFETPLTEIALQLEWAPFAKDWVNADGTYRKSWSPYLLAGIGSLFYNPSADFNENSNMASTMLNRIADDKNQNDNTTHVGLAVPFGGGIRIDLTPKLVLGIEAGLRLPVTDYLDGISEAANPDRKDWYGFGGVTLSYRFNKNKRKAALNDIDGDGVADAEDICPLAKGSAIFGGCPDTDGDGIADKDDGCPTLAGTLNGCPDSDNDGIADKHDNCPNERGSASDNGCPTLAYDSDGDGTPDMEDECPDSAGARMFGGCPDTDGDGIEDRNDDCPRTIGVGIFRGCPDTDGDGISDASDKCPKDAGSPTNNGCPLIKAVDKATIDFATKNISFETANSVLKKVSYSILDEIADIMNRYPNYNIGIFGHTDSTGSASDNLQLSKTRAKACHDYLIIKGIAPERITYKGLGETRPIADNENEIGRKKNRRVELKLKLNQ